MLDVRKELTLADRQSLKQQKDKKIAIQEQNNELAKYIELSKEDLSLLEHNNQVSESVTHKQKAMLETERERLILWNELDTAQQAFGKGLSENNKRGAEEAIAVDKKKWDEFNKGVDIRMAAAEEADDAEAKSIADRITAMKLAEEAAAASDKKVADRKATALKKANDLILSNTKDMESRILQEKLKAEDKFAEAAQEGIRRYYEKRMETATSKQKELLRQLMGLELAAAGVDPAVADSVGAGGGAAASIATAIGSFTVGATPELKELKKQTELQTETLAELKKDGGGGRGIVVAS
jgi:hypothetical protein